MTTVPSAATWPDAIEIQPVRGPVFGTPEIPGSKSITNRALVTAALAAGTSSLTGALFSDDTHYMAQALNRLGITVRTDEASRTMGIEGAGGRIPASSADLFIGNSGTTARFLAAVVALGTGRYRIDGDEAMRRRPIGPLLDALRQLGVDARSNNDNDCPPITIVSSGLPGGEVTMPGNLSSQYFTGLLLAAPGARGDITIHVEGELISRPYITITAEVMRTFGVEVDLGETSFRVPGGQWYEPTDYAIEPDASAASYFFAIAAITGGTITVEGLGTSALQGDLEFVRVLEAMGCTVEMTATATTVTGPTDGRLRGGEFDMGDISDTSQTLAGIAPFADGPVTFRGVAHNRVKETDRVGNVVRELRKLGQDVEEFEDGMTIYPRPVTPAVVETYNDHRMAMGFALTGLRSPGVVISNPACVTNTFPAFFEVLEGLVRRAQPDGTSRRTMIPGANPRI
ncbi:MAG: 3-phosphoshikimate 1-carboxyvinyltransferase [Chloroflexota bacterium]|nr:3-phosphoshikimate 1-carboxyvinyltransferase [Chloroflexota bacterium]